MRDKKSNNGASPFSVMHAALILLCAVLISGHLMGGIYARYATEDSGDDGARVIFFGDLTVTEENDLLVAPGATLQRQTYVSFDGSEARTYLFVHITFDKTKWKWGYGGKEIKTVETYPDKMIEEDVSIASIDVFRNWQELETFSEEKSEEYNGVFYLELEPNTKINKMPVFANRGYIDLPIVSMDTLKPLDGSSISVEVVVVQANGFESVQDAWNAVGGKS